MRPNPVKNRPGSGTHESEGLSPQRWSIFGLRASSNRAPYIPGPSKSRLSHLDEQIEKWKADNGVTGPVTVTAEKPQPQPFSCRGRVMDPNPRYTPGILTLPFKSVVRSGPGLVSALLDFRKRLLRN